MTTRVIAGLRDLYSVLHEIAKHVFRRKKGIVLCVIYY